MTFTSILWTTDGTGHGISGGYTQALLLDWMRRTMLEDGANQCILPAWLNECLVTNPSGKTIRVASGAGYVDGFPFDNNANVDLTPSTPATLARVDRVVVRANWTAQTVDAVILEGTEGAGVPPAVTQSSGSTWEVSLATYEISTGAAVSSLTDTREFIHFNSRVSTAMLDADAVTQAKIAALAVDTTELANDAVTQAKIDALAVGTIELANDAVDDTKAGNRVPQFYRRQGGSSTNWKTPGSSNYTPTKVRMQSGVIEVVFGAGDKSAYTDVTFPVAFGNVPVGFVSFIDASIGADLMSTVVANVQSASVLRVNVVRDHTGSYTYDVAWLAIGEE